MISKREREPSSSFEGSEEDQRERRRTFDIELILWGTNSDHSGDRSPPESVTTREITKLEILVVAAERSSVLVLARALQSLAVRRLVCILGAVVRGSRREASTWIMVTSAERGEDLASQTEHIPQPPPQLWDDLSHNP